MQKIDVIKKFTGLAFIDKLRKNEKYKYEGRNVLGLR